MPSSTLEEKKLDYSRQLAEHTLRQWNSVRQSDVSPSSRQKLSTRRKSSTKYVAPRSDSSDSDSDAEQTPHVRRKDGVQVVDYGKLSPRHGKPADKRNKQ